MKALLCVCVMAGVAAADHHSLPGTPGASFDFAEPWAAQDSPDHSTVVYKVDSRFAIFVVFSPHAGTLEVRF